MTVEAVLVTVADDECGLTGIAVQGDMISDEAVPEAILWWCLGLQLPLTRLGSRIQDSDLTKSGIKAKLYAQAFARGRLLS